MILFIYLYLFVTGLFLPVSENKATEVAVLRADPCQLFGSVYLELDPRNKSYARYSVYIEEEEGFADLLVFKEDNKLFADQVGLWHLAGNRTFADHVFFVTKNRAQADFSIHYTTVRSFAGCNR